MTAKVYLSLVFHNHQPVGNFDFVFEEAFQKSYLPLIEVLERHPRVKVGMHFSGCLRDWILQHKPDYYPRVRKLVTNGQLEILSGAYYEPVLVMLSDEDKVGQIDKLNAAVRDDFGQEPKGMWLAERVWEPSLAKPIAQTGLTYTIVDDTHFNFAGFDDDQLFGYYITEEQGHNLAVFPSLKKMRYLFPWGTVEDNFTWMRQVADQYGDQEVPPLVFMGDDGEKFGLWPGTYEHMWEQGYMDEYFTRVAAESDWLEIVTPGEYMEKFPALGRAYMPTASYIEMTEWALPPEHSHELTHMRHELEHELEDLQDSNPARADYIQKLQRYLRGGFWRNFMVKYPEINHMQKRGMYTSARLHNQPDGPTKSQALAHLWASQCNCAYWHGVFGGVYLFHIRAANYANLLAAEALMLDDKMHAEQIDFDQDSRDELIVTGQPFSLVFDLARGGSLIEWDDIPSRYNLVNIMTRRREGYHADLENAAIAGTIVTPDSPRWNTPENIHSETVRAKERGLDQRLFNDWYRHGSFIDHFLRDDVHLSDFQRAAYGEEGDFVNQPYQASIKGSGNKTIEVTLTRDGNVWHNGIHEPVRVAKVISATSGSRELSATYTITNNSQQHMNTRFGVEMSYGFDGGNSEFCYLAVPKAETVNLSEIVTREQVKDYTLGTRIRGFEVKTTLDQPVTLWQYPLEPVTISEGGFERIHQGAVLLHVFSISVAPGASWTTTLKFVVGDVERV